MLSLDSLLLMEELALSYKVRSLIQVHVDLEHICPTDCSTVDRGRSFKQQKLYLTAKNEREALFLHSTYLRIIFICQNSQKQSILQN